MKLKSYCIIFIMRLSNVLNFFQKTIPNKKNILLIPGPVTTSQKSERINEC